jgi:hypothetical protein
MDDLVRGLTGIFLTSEHVETTAQFYERIACVSLERVVQGDYAYYKATRSGIQLAIHDAKAFAKHAYPAQASSNLTHLYFQIADQARFLQYLEAAGLKPFATDDVTVTVVDPDGREVLFGTV